MRDGQKKNDLNANSERKKNGGFYYFQDNIFSIRRHHLLACLRKQKKVYI